MRKTALLTAALFSGLLACSATIVPYGYYNFSTTGNPGADSSGRGFQMDSYVGVGGSGDPGNGLIIPNFGVGGPLGGTNGNAGITSTSCVKAHAGGGNGGCFWIDTGGSFNLQYSNNWVMECWALANQDGVRNGVDGAYIASIGHYNGTGGTPNLGNSWGCIFFAKNYAPGSGMVYAQCLAVDATNGSLFQLGPDVLIKNGSADNRWVHLAAVRDNLAGTVTFYTNGVACAVTNAAVVRQNPVSNATAGMPGFAGSQGGPIIGAGNAFEGYMDELRFGSFADGQFSLTNLLTRAPGPGIVTQPQSLSAYNGGAAPFKVVAAYDTSLTYQWYRGPNALSGATSNLYVLAPVSSADHGTNFTCVLTDYTGLSKTTSVATLTVLAYAGAPQANVEVYQNAVKTTPALLAYFPVDGCTSAGVLTNVMDNSRTHDGVLEGDAFYTGSTNRAEGLASVFFPGQTVLAGNNSDVMINNDPAYEFAGGFGTIEAVLYVDSSIGNVLANESPVWFAEQYGYYTLYANASTITVGANLNASVSWTAPGGLSGKSSHVVIAFDNATNVTAYVNGVNLGTKVLPNGFNPGMMNNVFYIGSSGAAPTSYGYATTLFHGAVDELAIYGTNLSANTVLDHYNKYFFGTNTSPGSVASVTPSAKRLWTGFPYQTLTVVGGGTPPFNYQWYSNTVALAAGTNATLLVSNLAVGTYNYTVTVGNTYGTSPQSSPAVLTVAAPAAGYETAVASSSGGPPQAFWRLNETSGTLATDLAGTHDAKYFGGFVQNVAGAFAGQNGVQFFGTNAPGNVLQNATRVEAPFYPELNNPRGPITVEFWYKHNNVGNPNNSSAARYPFASMHQTGGTDNGIMFAESFNTGAAWTVVGWCYGNNNPARSMTVEQANTKIVTGRWEHAVFTWDGDNGGNPAVTAPGNGQLYVNGKLEGTRAYSFHQTDGTTRLDQYANNDSGPLVIGNLPNGRTSASVTYAQPFTGAFADVAIYNYAMSATDVSNHYFFAASPSAIVTQPVGATNTESFSASVTLTAGVSGQPITSYQWYKDGALLNATKNPDGTAHYPTVGNPGFYTQGVQSSKLVISELRTNDTGNYWLVVGNPILGSTSVVAYVLINQDTTSPLPAPTGAQGLGLTVAGPVWSDILTPGSYGTIPPPALVKVTFNTRLDFATATNPANYVLSGGTGTVSSVVISSSPADLLFGADSKTVSLLTTGLEPGKNYLLTVSNVKEQRSRAAAIAPTTLYFTTPVYTPGTLCWDYYYKIPRTTSGTSVQRIYALGTNNQGQLPYLPQRELSITNFDTHQLGNPVSSAIVGNQGDDYVAVVSGWITPTVTDSYDFWLAADDRAGFWMNPSGADSSGAYWPGAASVNGSWPFDVSTLYYTGVSLTAGVSYYVQAVMLEDGGGDWVAVGWKGSQETYTYNGGRPTNGIPSINVGSYSRGPAPAFSTPVVSGGNTTISWTGLGRLMQSSNVALPLLQWTAVPGNPSSPYVVTPAGSPQMYYRILQ
jgi:hypothetical protein